MDSCASCGAELGGFQAFCAECGATSTSREVSLDTLLECQNQNDDELHSDDEFDAVEEADADDAHEGESTTPAPLADLAPWLPDRAVLDPVVVEDDEDWDLQVPTGVPLRLVPLRETEDDDLPDVDRPEDFWWPSETDPPPAAETPEPVIPAPVPPSASLYARAVPVPPPLPPLLSTQVSSELSSDAPESVAAEPETETAEPGAADEVDPWGVPISPVPLADPKRPLFVDEAPGRDDNFLHDTSFASLPRVGQMPYVAPRRSVPVGAVVAFVLSGVAGSAAIGLLAVPVANADACSPTAVPSVAAPSATPSQGPTLEEVTAQLNAADVDVSAAEAKATDAEQRLAAARTALETATAATRMGGVDQSALTAAEAEVTRAASALQAAEAAQRSAAAEVSRQANAGDWELDMLRAAEKERDQFSHYDPSDPYWDNEVVKAEKAYQQALEPQRRAASALATANSALATARNNHTSAVSARDQVTGRNSQAVARAEEDRKKAQKQVTRAEKAQAKAQSELVDARQARDEIEAQRRDLDQAESMQPAAAVDPADAAECDTAKRERRTAASVAGGTSLAAVLVGTALTVRHRRGAR